MARRRDEKGRGLLHFFTIVGFTATVLGLVSAGMLSGAQGGAALIAMVLVVSLASRLGTSVTRVVLGVGLPLMAMALLVIREGKGNTQAMTALAGAILALLIALFGIFIIIRGRGR